MTEPSVAIAMPMRDKPEPETQWCLENHLPPNVVDVLHEIGKPVEEARNILSARLRALDPRPDVVIWADADVWFEADFVERFAASIMSCDETTLVGTVHSAREERARAQAWPLDSDLPVPPSGKAVRDWTMPVPSEYIPSTKLLPVRGIGAHCIGHRTALLDALPEDPWGLDISVLEETFDDPVEHLLACRARLETSEDIAFNRRVECAGGKRLLDCSAFVGHVEGRYMFVPGRRVYQFFDHVPVEMRNGLAYGSVAGTRKGDYGKTVSRASVGYLEVLATVLLMPGGIDRAISRLRARDGDAWFGPPDYIAADVLEVNRERFLAVKDACGPSLTPEMVAKLTAGALGL